MNSHKAAIHIYSNVFFKKTTKNLLRYHKYHNHWKSEPEMYQLAKVTVVTPYVAPDEIETNLRK